MKTASLALLASVAFAQPASAQEQRREFIELTYYLPTGNVMRSGLWPYIGAAACDTSVFPMGTILELDDGFQVECLDTGYLRRGQVDIYAPTRSWASQNVLARYGRFAWADVVRWGFDG